MDNLFEQMANISKAHAYDIVSKQRNELLEENKQLKEDYNIQNHKYAECVSENEKLKEQVKVLQELERSFYMDICRAYNAGKQNQVNIVLAIGSPDEGKMFLSSHDYFVTEFPEFKTNVP